VDLSSSSCAVAIALFSASRPHNPLSFHPIECAEPHFEQKNCCPVCNRQNLTAKDVVRVDAGPPQPLLAIKAPNITITELLTRNLDPGKPHIGLEKLCTRVINGQQQQKLEVSFLLKRLCNEAKLWRVRCTNKAREHATDREKVKQLQNALSAQAQELSQAKALIEEKDRMIRNFRQGHISRTVSAHSSRSQDHGYGHGQTSSGGIRVPPSKNLMHGIRGASGHSTMPAHPNGYDTFGSFSPPANFESPMSAGNGRQFQAYRSAPPQSSQSSHSGPKFNKRRQGHDMGPPTSRPRYPGRSPSGSATMWSH
jgi:hypothetical protein